MERVLTVRCSPQAQGRARAENSSYTLVDVHGSGVVEKELVNEFRQKMMNKAIVKIGNMDQEEFKKKVKGHEDPTSEAQLDAADNRD